MRINVFENTIDFNSNSIYDTCLFPKFVIDCCFFAPSLMIHRKKIHCQITNIPVFAVCSGGKIDR